ncbi:MAG: DNA-binding protein [Dehalococcoidia bacterium]|nr:DNA-binding protein [Dehalococcoidia bacterium]MSQ35341.1 DNA-binding protein [Dehalococcoidia bacterium]
MLLLTPEEAADRLRIGRSMLYELLTARQIESVRINRSRRIPVAALEAYVRRLCDAAQTSEGAL